MREPYSEQALPILSDIHGNRAGLKAILACLEYMKVTRPPLLLGDLVWTHFVDRSPADLVDLLDMIMDIPLTGVICGNTDAYFVNGWLERWNPADEDEQRIRSHMLAFKALLKDRHLGFLETLQDRNVFRMCERECLACHASPLDNATGLPLDVSVSEADERLDGIRVDCLLTGHLHTSFTRLMANGCMHVSVGAVGRHPHEFDGIVDFAVLDSTPMGLVAVHHRLPQSRSADPTFVKNSFSVAGVR
jgi:hypothetical protein